MAALAFSWLQMQVSLEGDGQKPSKILLYSGIQVMKTALIFIRLCIGQRAKYFHALFPWILTVTPRDKHYHCHYFTDEKVCVCVHPMLIGDEKTKDIQNLKDSPWWPLRRRQSPSNPVLNHHTVGTSPTTCTSSGSSSREHILPIPSHSLSGDTYSLFSSNSKPKWDSSYP